ncbi:MAG: hypothetical protein HLUCCA04_09255 [Oceanicaulis sp. HLUCCA04]|nr:MAG: hypothetical protein HLUCCA04_09255 [Oceanicaulis sp. HLUCCA04]
MAKGQMKGNKEAKKPKKEKAKVTAAAPARTAIDRMKESQDRSKARKPS